MFITCADLEATFWEAAIARRLFTGAAGDITQVDNRRAGREFGEEWARMFGFALAGETVQTIERMSWRKDALIEAAQTFVKIPIRDLSEAGETPMLGLGAGSVVDKIYARERELLELERTKRPVIPCEVQAIRIGELGIVTNGAEFFCQLRAGHQGRESVRATWVVSLANDWIGYVATPSAYYAGGYEPRTARSAKMAAWAGQALVEGSLAALVASRQSASRAGSRVGGRPLLKRDCEAAPP